MQKIPPYGKLLAEMQAKGEHPSNSVIIHIGFNAWAKAGNGFISRPTRTLVLPPYECPTEYHWPVKDCDIWIWDTECCNDDYVKDLVFQLYKNEALIVRYTDSNLESKTFYKE